MRLLLVSASIPALLFGQDAREIVRRAVETDRNNQEIARNYTFLEREERRELDGAGKTKSARIRTWDVTLLEGSPFKRLVARDDKPLSPDEVLKEQERLAKSIDERRKETAAQREKRLAEWRKRQERDREPLREMLEALDFKLSGEEKLNGIDVYVIDATPQPGYKPKTRSGSILSKLKARFWIEKAQHHWAKVDLETLDTISFGQILFRLSTGSRIVIEQVKVNDEVWLLQNLRIQAGGRLLLVRGIRLDQVSTYSGFKKFSAESRVVSTAEHP